MATGSNNRDVELRVATKTSGTEQLQELGKELLNAAKKGGEAAPEFERLAKEVDKLSQQTDAVRVLEQLSIEVAKTGDSLNAAKQKAELLGQVFQEQATKTEAFRASQQEARAAIEGTEQKLLEARAALNTFKANADAAERATRTYKDELKDLRSTVAELENTLAQQKALAASKTEINAVERELTNAQAAYEKAQKSVAKFEQSLADQNARIEASKSAMAEIGLVAKDVAEAQTLIDKAVTATTQEINAQKSVVEAYEAELRSAAQAEKQFADLRAFEEKRQEAIKLQQAADYVNFWTTALTKAEAAEKSLREESQRAAAALGQAFATTGVRSAEAIRAEIEQINRSLIELATNSKVSGADFDRAFASAKERVNALDRELRGLPASVNETNSLVGILRQSFSQLTAAFGAFEIGRAFFTANTQFETLRRTMTLITGSAEGAAEQIKFLRETANTTGLSVGALAQDFINFTASANTSGIAIEKQRDIFSAVANAAGQLGLTTDRVGLILQALAQTANKGKVSLEELQGQLGESLPGALAIVANGFSVTKERLLEMVKAGIDTNSFFDAFVRGSKAAFGDGSQQVNSFAAAVNRLKNSFNELFSRAADTASFKLLVSLIDGAASNLGTLVSGVESLIKGFLAFKAIGIAQEFFTIESATASLAKTKAALAVETSRAAVAEREAAAATASHAQASASAATAASGLAVARERGAVATAGETAATATNTEATLANTTAKTAAAVAATEAALGRERQVVAIATENAALAANSAATTANTTAKGFAASATAALAVAYEKTAAAASGILTRVGSLTSALGGPYGVALTGAIAFSEQLGNGLASLAAKFSGVTDTLKENEKRIREMLAVNEDAVRSNQRVAESFSAVAARYNESAKLAEKATETAKKLVEAKKIEGDAATSIIKLYGDEVLSRDAASKAAQGNVAVSANLVTAYNTEISLLTRKRDEQIAAVGSYAALTEAQRNQVDELQALIDKKTAERDLSTARLNDAKVEALQAEASAKSTRDNSAALDELRRARDQASVTLDRYTILERAGLVVGTDLVKMRRDLATAELLYRDALADTSRNAQINVQAMQAAFAMSQANRNVKLAEAQAAERVAEALGNERLATEAKIETKRIEIQNTEAAIAQKKREAEASIALLTAQRNEIVGTDDISEAKRREIDLRIANEKAKIREADAGKAVVAALEAERDAILRRNSASAGSLSKPRDTLSGGKSDEQLRAERLAGNTGPVDNSYIFRLRERLLAGEMFGADERPAIENALRAAKENAYFAARGANGIASTVPSLNQDVFEWVSVLQRVLEKTGSSVAGGTSNVGFAGAGAASRATPSGYNVNITLGGQPTTINTASQADAEKLTNLLRQIGDAANRSG